MLGAKQTPYIPPVGSGTGYPKLYVSVDGATSVSATVDANLVNRDFTQLSPPETFDKMVGVEIIAGSSCVLVQLADKIVMAPLRYCNDIGTSPAFVIGGAAGPTDPAGTEILVRDFGFSMRLQTDYRHTDDTKIEVSYRIIDFFPSGFVKKVGAAIWETWFGQ